MSFAKMVSPTKKICLQTTTIFVNIVAIVLKIATSMCVRGAAGMFTQRLNMEGPTYLPFTAT